MKAATSPWKISSPRVFFVFHFSYFLAAKIGFFCTFAASKKTTQKYDTHKIYFWNQRNNRRKHR